MSVIKVTKRTAAADIELLELNRIREEWEASRKQLDTELLLGMCAISECRTMPFVTLKTSAGPRGLCLRHFEKLRADAA